MASFRKEFLAAKVQRLVAGQRLVAVASASNLNLAATQHISTELGQVGAEVSFIKNSLMSIGLENAGLGPLAGFLRGPTCLIAGDAELDVAKKIVALQKKAREIPHTRSSIFFSQHWRPPPPHTHTRSRHATLTSCHAHLMPRRASGARTRVKLQRRVSGARTRVKRQRRVRVGCAHASQAAAEGA